MNIDMSFSKAIDRAEDWIELYGAIDTPQFTHSLRLRHSDLLAAIGSDPTKAGIGIQLNATLSRLSALGAPALQHALVTIQEQVGVTNEQVSPRIGKAIETDVKVLPDTLLNLIDDPRSNPYRYIDTGLLDVLSRQTTALNHFAFQTARYQNGTAAVKQEAFAAIESCLESPATDALTAVLDRVHSDTGNRSYVRIIAWADREATAGSCNRPTHRYRCWQTALQSVKGPQYTFGPFNAELVPALQALGRAIDTLGLLEISIACSGLIPLYLETWQQLHETINAAAALIEIRQRLINAYAALV